MGTPSRRRLAFILVVVPAVLLATPATGHVAYQAGRRVMRIAPGGATSTVYRSSRPWAPVGVAVHGDSGYVLEFGREPGSSTSGPRMRRIDASGEVTTLVTVGG